MWLDQIKTIRQKALLDGLLFVGGYVFSAVAAAGTVQARITLPAGVKNHLVDARVAAGGLCTVTSYKDTTYSAAGTAVALSNRNLSSSNAAVALAYQAPTVNVLGSLLNTELLEGGAGGGANPVLPGAEAGDNFGFVLGAGNDLLLQAVNNSGAAIDIGVIFTAAQMP